MGDQQRAAAVQAGPAAVVSCWLCGMRLSAALMVSNDRIRATNGAMLLVLKDD